MAATTTTSLITQVRRQLVEASANFWSDDELKDIMALGVTDLWGAILDLHQDHYFEVIEDGSFKQEAGKSQLTGVPDDCFRVMLIEPLDLTGGSGDGSVIYVPRKYNHEDFSAARSIGSVDSAAGVRAIYYDVTGPGAPVAAPKIRVAPKVNTNIALRLAYLPMLVMGDFNPVGGGSDNALKAWTLAYAMAKEGPNGSRIPDAGWLAVYATEKQTILVRMAPRQEQAVEVVDGLFDNYL